MSDKQMPTTTYVVDDIVHSSASTPLWTQTIVANGQKNSTVRRLSQRFL